MLLLKISELRGPVLGASPVVRVGMDEYKCLDRSQAGWPRFSEAADGFLHRVQLYAKGRLTGDIARADIYDIDERLAGRLVLRGALRQIAIDTEIEESELRPTLL